MPLQQLTLADTDAVLASALAGLGDLEAVGVDVERSDWDRYYRAAALIQVGGNGRVVLVDPLALCSLEPLETFLAARTTILHACENDLEPLATLGVRPPRVEDTALAAAVLGLPTGLEQLLTDLLGVELGGDKAAMQRADWEARPLTQGMQAYAAGDVADLPALWADLQHRLDQADRTSWYREELAAVLALPPVEARRAWTRTKGAGRLSRPARIRLRALWETRERLGRETDTAPARIAGDKVLLDLATAPPTAVSELPRRGVRRQAVRRFGEDLLAAVDHAHAGADDPGDREPHKGRAPTEEDRALADRLRVLRAERARALGIDAGVLCPGRTLMAAVVADPKTPEALRDALGLRSWQWQQIGDAFCDALELHGAGRPAPVTTEGEPDDG
ncbi:MAG TPA: HRDC domain-containing protein [Egibacteraceae bacterium]|nr:HRDC domain-containing protein [Egibacteraceae bacterium]